MVNHFLIVSRVAEEESVGVALLYDALRRMEWADRTDKGTITDCALASEMSELSVAWQTSAREKYYQSRPGGKGAVQVRGSNGGKAAGSAGHFGGHGNQDIEAFNQSDRSKHIGPQPQHAPWYDPPRANATLPYQKGGKGKGYKGKGNRDNEEGGLSRRDWDKSRSRSRRR